jgi:hypothetical protein
MALYRGQVRDAMVAALLQGQTFAGRNVFAPRDWPEEPVDLPSIIVSMPAETKTSLGPVGPKFSTTATIVVLARIIGTTAIDAEAQMEQFIDQIQFAVLTDLSVLSLVEKFTTVETYVNITDLGEDQVAECSIAFGAEYPEFFRPGIPQPLTDIKFTIPVGTQQILVDDMLPQPA